MGFNGSIEAVSSQNPLKRSPSAVATLSLNVQYSLASIATCCFVSGHPFLFMVRTAFSSGYTMVSFWKSSYRSNDMDRTVLIS